MCRRCEEKRQLQQKQRILDPTRDTRPERVGAAIGAQQGLTSRLRAVRLDHEYCRKGQFARRCLVHELQIRGST